MKLYLVVLRQEQILCVIESDRNNTTADLYALPVNYISVLLLFTDLSAGIMESLPFKEYK